MTLSDNYTQLKRQIVASVVNSERPDDLLNILKELFRDVINSPRRYENIETIGSLLRILEIRDELSENNVSPLKMIASKIANHSDLLQKINDYERNRLPEEFANFYASENINSTPHRPMESSIVSNPNMAMSEKKQKLIIDTVIEDIGTFWRDLARCLEIKEKYIDELDVNGKDVKEKAKAIMDMYQKKADNQNWLFELCDALETCRRKDLVKKLKKITIRNM